jgi:hypothetical protein
MVFVADCHKPDTQLSHKSGRLPAVHPGGWRGLRC